MVRLPRAFAHLCLRRTAVTTQLPGDRPDDDGFEDVRRGEMSPPSGREPAEIEPLEVRAVHVYRLRVPFVSPRVTAYGTLVDRETILVRVDTDSSIGWGECPAPAAPSFSTEFAAGAFALIVEVLAPALVEGATPKIRGNRMARAALADACLDARLRAGGISLSDFVGGSERPLAAAVISLQEDVEAVRESVAEVVAGGVGAVVLKVAPGRFREPVLTLREEFGDLLVAADGNGSFAPDEEELEAADEAGLVWLAEPAADLAGNLAVAERLSTPVALDETLEHPAAFEIALRSGMRGALDVKPARLGGVQESARLIDRGIAAGWLVSVGGTWETGIGRSAAAALASRDGVGPMCTLTPVTDYLVDDLVGGNGPRLVGGRVVPPEGPGIGVSPPPSSLERFCVEQVTIE